MLPAIRVKVLSRADKLNEWSRINFAKTYTVEHNVKVYDVGHVRSEYIRALAKNYDKVQQEIDEHGGDSSSEASEASGSETDGPSMQYRVAQAFTDQSQFQQSQRDAHNHYLIQFYAQYLANTGRHDVAQQLLQSSADIQLQICAQLMQQGIRPPGE